MHHPPEVQFLLDGSPLQRRLLVIVGLLAVLEVSWLAISNQLPILQLGALVVCALLAIGWAWFQTPPAVSGNLHWDGVQWHWPGHSGSSWTLRRHLDLQSVMLVSLQHRGNTSVWLWLHCSQDPDKWQALRRAVVYTTAATHRGSIDETKRVHHTVLP